MRPEAPGGAPRILVGTLFAGENELERCIASLRAQTWPHWEQRIFRHLPNREAHAAVYGAFAEGRGAFDLFLKLDADMVLRHERALEQIAALFRAEPELDHLEMAVHDWFSDSLILGVHVYTPRVRFEAGDEALFVDMHASHPGRKRYLWDGIAPLVDHCPDPDAYQAFAFGVHRALKALQRERPPEDFDPVQSLVQFRILRRTWEHYTRCGDARLAVALLGAEGVLRGELGAATLEDKGRLAAPFAAAEALDEAAARRRLAARWSRWRLREALHYARVGLRLAGAVPARLAAARRRSAAAA